MVERLFCNITDKRIRRDSFTSVAELELAIGSCNVLPRRSGVIKTQPLVTNKTGHPTRPCPVWSGASALR